MNSFTIRDIENLSGIKAHTLRVWEQRYRIIQPMRKDSNHRLYGINDLKHILRIAYLYEQGYKISRIAEMSESEIKKLALETGAKGSHEIFINQLLEASIDFDEDQFRKVLDKAADLLGIEKSLPMVVYPFLNKAGLLWMTGNIIPAQEHFASNIIRNKLLLAIDSLPANRWRHDKKYLLFNPPGEFHEIPLLYTSYCLKKRGIPNVLFGVNTRVEELREYLEKNRCTHLFLFLTTNFTQQAAGDFLEELEVTFPELQIEAAGNSFRQVDPVSRQTVNIFRTVQDFLAQLDK